MVATNFHTDSLGSCVSESRVITYLTLASVSWSPTTNEKSLRPRFRKKAFNADSFPLLRS